MSNDKSNTSGGQDAAKPDGYGTVPVKKSDDTPTAPLTYGTIKIRESVDTED
jgi:hypothetical protein